MAIYKITNLTNLAGKREANYNSTLGVDYVDAMVKKTIQIKPGETAFLQISSLPISVHKLRVKKLISVVEISANELQKTIDATKLPAAPKREIPVAIETEEEKKITNKRKLGRGIHEGKAVENE